MEKRFLATEARAKKNIDKRYPALHSMRDLAAASEDCAVV
jgi:hypothetical protein